MDKQSVSKKHKGEESRGVTKPTRPRQLCWWVIRAPKEVMRCIQDSVPWRWQRAARCAGSISVGQCLAPTNPLSPPP